MCTTNLPIQLTNFVGREREIADVKRLLFSSHLVTLTGAGGSGKTRLAIQIAYTVVETFTDGVWLVDLGPLREPALVPQLVTLALGLHPIADQPLLETLQNFVRSRQLLLVLDNCEHLNAACAQLAQGLLSQAPELRILASSRMALAIVGETIYPVSGLDWPIFDRAPVQDGQSRLDLQELMGYDAVRLFVERARAISSNFSLTPENAGSTVEICRRLDGLPLALELASARVNVLTVQEIAARLNDRFALLVSSQRRGLEPRHHTLRAAIDWSYALLPVDEQLMLRRLAVFEAGCTLDTVEAICTGEGIAAEDTLDRISSLVSKSLVVADTVGRAQARYRLLETIREYALEKLKEAGEIARLRDRHLDLFLTRAEEAAPKLNDAYQQLWLNWLEGEHANLRAALAWSLESGRIEVGLRIAIALYRFWEIRGYVPEGLIWFERLLTQADEGISEVVRANAFTYAAFLAMFLGNTSATVAYGTEAAALAEAADDKDNPILVLALGGLASSAQAIGDNQTAFTIQERMIQLLRNSSGTPFLLGMLLFVQGKVAIELGYYELARPLLDESLAIAREAADAFRIAHALDTLGDLARCEQNYAEAKAYYQQSAALLHELGAVRDLANCLANLGYTCLHLGDPERAQTLFNENMTAHQAQQNNLEMAKCLIGFGACAIVGGMFAAGARLLAAAVAIGGPRVASEQVTTRMEYERYRTLARAKLTEAEIKMEQAIGQKLSLEQAVEYAQRLPLPFTITPAPQEKPDYLTGREREVATLIAEGKSNGEIAGELVLSKRTVEKHVANILARLELTSRAQIVRWAMEHGLTHAAE